MDDQQQPDDQAAPPQSRAARRTARAAAYRAANAQQPRGAQRPVVQQAPAPPARAPSRRAQRPGNSRPRASPARNAQRRGATEFTRGAYPPIFPVGPSPPTFVVQFHVDLFGVMQHLTAAVDVMLHSAVSANMLAAIRLAMPAREGAQLTEQLRGAFLGGGLVVLSQQLLFAHENALCPPVHITGLRSVEVLHLHSMVTVLRQYGSVVSPDVGIRFENAGVRDDVHAAMRIAQGCVPRQGAPAMMAELNRRAQCSWLPLSRTCERSRRIVATAVQGYLERNIIGVRISVSLILASVFPNVAPEGAIRPLWFDALMGPHLVQPIWDAADWDWVFSPIPAGDGFVAQFIGNANRGRRRVLIDGLQLVWNNPSPADLAWEMNVADVIGRVATEWVRFAPVLSTHFNTEALRQSRDSTSGSLTQISTLETVGRVATLQTMTTVDAGSASLAAAFHPRVFIDRDETPRHVHWTTDAIVEVVRARWVQADINLSALT